MSRRKGKSREAARTRAADRPSTTKSAQLFPHLNRLVEEIQKAQDQFEQLRAENQGLKGQLEKRGQELAHARQQVTDLKAECESLKQQAGLAEEEIARSRTDALVSLFTDMVNERHNHLLRKLLAFNDEEPELLRDLVRYLRDDLRLALEGEIDAEVTLTEQNLDCYELQEAVTLPCRAKIIGRGISFEGRPILRAEVEPVAAGEETNDGN